MKKKMNAYLVAGSRPWNKTVFTKKISKYPGKWHFISRPEQLTVQFVEKIKPRYIFFLHWSWFIPEEIYKPYECIVFHMTDLPFGRGGSPLQNLIIRGIYKTKISAIRVVKELDAGAVYSKKPLDLVMGSAGELYKKASDIASGMIKDIVFRNSKPRPQKGRVVIFKRRKPEESCIPANLTGRQLYDFIRMLDAEGYPRAFVEQNGYRIEFSNALLIYKGVRADVIFIKKNE